ncbi:MAG: DNA gyrase inhibitor YacG [Terricaulis silvestris]
MSEASARKCAICGKPQNEKYRPFCSKRCADVDLNRWLSGGYAIPAEEADELSEEHKAREE